MSPQMAITNHVGSLSKIFRTKGSVIRRPPHQHLAKANGKYPVILEAKRQISSPMINTTNVAPLNENHENTKHSQISHTSHNWTITTPGVHAHQLHDHDQTDNGF